MKRSRKAIVIGVAVLILALLIGAGIWILTGSDETPGTQPGTQPSTGATTLPGTQPSDAHVHSYGSAEILQAATCDQDGTEVSRCACGAEFFGVIKATGHAMGEWTTDVEPNCNMTGTMSAVCSVCSQKETKVIPCTKHEYQIVESDTTATAGGTQYLCAICADQFTVASTVDADVWSARYIADCEPNYTFKIYCEKDAAYIYEHLYIVDAYFHHTENEVRLGYTVHNTFGHWWTVTPAVPYTPGDIYIASRSGEVFFENYGVQDLTFVIKREESKVMELSEDVIFLQTLENEDPGYYPYTLDYSEATDTYWLSLNKLGNLEVGDTVCVGNAQSLDDIINQDEESDIFGKIRSIEYSQSGGNYLIELEGPDLTELFSALDVHSSDMIPLDNIQMSTQEQLTAQAKQILYQSEDFAKFVCAARSTSVSYLSVRGLHTNLTSLKDFFDQIEISDEGTVYPTLSDDGVITGKIVLNGSIVVPVTLTGDPDGAQVGEIKIYFQAFVELNSLTVMLDIQSREVEIKDAEKIVKMQVGTNQMVTTGFTFGVELNLDWSLGAKPYVLNTKSGTYHFKSCKHIAAVKDPSQLQKLSAEELLMLIAEEKVDVKHECKTCLPISSMLADHYVLNSESKLVHLPTCAHIKKSKNGSVQVSELPYGNILAMGYTECKDCAPSSRYTNSFSEQILEKMKYEDLGDSLDQFKELAEELSNDDGAQELQIAKIPFTITGVDVIELQLSVYFDFSLEVTMEYHYTVQTTSSYGIYLTQDGFEAYSDSTPTTTANNITVTGKVRVDLGMIAGINVHIKGIEKYCFVELNAKVGLYAKIQGALKHDFLLSSNSYAAAYFEAGVHCDLIGSAKLAKWESLNHSFLPEELRDHPFLSYGFEKVYYNFDLMPELVQIDSIYYNLEKAQLMNVKYYNIIQMEEGTDSLSITGINGKYSVEFQLKNGTNCTIDTGYLLVNTPDVAFEDELTITIKGYDTWGKYRRGNTKYDVGSYTVKISYDPLKNAVSLPDTAVEYNGHYYQVYHGVANTWEEAKAYCESLGGYLATISTQAENDFVYNLVNTSGCQSAYFGLTDSGSEGTWRNANGEELVFLNWAEGEPSNEGGDENYAMFYYQFPDGKWNDGDFGGDTLLGGIAFVCEWGVYEDTSDMTMEEHLNAVTGYYEGWYTASQGITKGTFGIHRTNALLADQQALQMYANWATDCSRNSEGVAAKTYTVDDIVSVLEKHTEEYVVLFMFGPLRQNPGVEDGVYTMTITYDEAAKTYKLKGSTWIQRDSYVFADFANMKLSGANFLGDVYGDYVEWFWTNYGDIGDVSLVRFDPLQNP